MSGRSLRACWILALVFWCHLSNTFAFQVLVDLNTYRKYDTNSVSDVQYLKCDGVWAIPQNDSGTFTQAEWGTMQNVLGPWVVSEDNPGGHWDYDYMTQAIGRPPNDAMCYNETGGTPGGTTLTDQQIVEQSATHGGSVVVLTRAGGGEWITQLDCAFASTQVTAPASTGQGILLVNGTLGGLGTVTVQTNAVLGGTGVIMGPVTVQVGGTRSPGTGLGTLSVSNALTLDAGSTTFAEVNAQSLAHDLVQGITLAFQQLDRDCHRRIWRRRVSVHRP